jgi:HEAT repeat protein
VRAPLRFAAIGLAWASAPVGPVAAEPMPYDAWARLRDRAVALLAAPGNVAEKDQAARLLLQDGDDRSWRVLREGLEREGAHLDALAAARTSAWDELAPTWAVPRPSRATTRRALARIRVLEAADVAHASERRFAEATADALAAAPRDGWLPLLWRAAGSEETRTPSPFRVLAARVAAAHAGETDAEAPLRRLLEEDEDPRVRMAALLALSGRDDASPSSVVGRLGDPDWAVRVAAAKAIGRRKFRSAVPALVRALAKERPRVVEACLEALRAVSGEDLGDDPEAWGRWWRKEGRPGAPARDPRRDLTFYGVPLRSDRVVFVLDVSGSMRDPSAVGPAGGPPAARIDLAKRELRHALRSMPATTRFAMIAFGSSVMRWRPEPVEASPAVVEEAVAWVDGLSTRGYTCLAGALRSAFRTARMAPLEAAESPIDTVFVLSDGRPTLLAERSPRSHDPEDLLALVRAWNADGRIQIHAVDVGKGDGTPFLKRLAGENGGLFSKR